LKVPQCDGKVHQLVADRFDRDGKILPTRRYYQLLPVQHPYQLSQQ
jgi:hypothetical protein